ncbi:FAD-dependent oxidoreductase [Streptomyces lydicus]|uniref:FAD-dependent oxidoreductase n=1 Tax=Streptomyces lydicus TaxID=47763 RepID=UPI00378F4DCD
MADVLRPLAGLEDAVFFATLLDGLILQHVQAIADAEDDLDWNVNVDHTLRAGPPVRRRRPHEPATRPTRLLTRGAAKITSPSLTGLLDTSLNLPPTEVAHFLGRLLVHLTSCELRRIEQWERVPWWTFINADAMSREYQQLLGVGITRDLVAVQAEVASTRTVARLNVHGHVIHVDSPWVLTSVSQAQFWKGRDFRSTSGDGEVADCLSVDISAWDRPGILYGRPGLKCTPDEVRREVWAQLKAGLNGAGRQVLADADLHSWFMDPAVTGLGGPAPSNREQLLIHPVGTWYDRPSSRTAVPNLFLAGDYVATDIGLATMEGANESARRAVNALLDTAGSTAPRCRVRRLHRPPELAFLHKLDEIRYRSGLPNLFDRG